MSRTAFTTRIPGHPTLFFCATLILGLVVAGPGGAPLIQGGLQENWVISGPGIERVAVTGQSFTEAFSVKVPVRPDKLWDVQIEGRCAPALSTGTVEISFSLRSKSPHPEGLCTVSAKLLTRPKNDGLGRFDARAGNQWKTIKFYCPVKTAYPENTVALALMFGGEVQELEIANIAVALLSEDQVAAAQAEALRKQQEEVLQRPRIKDLPPLPAGDSWKLTFQDEFDGLALDESKWNVGEGKRHDIVRSRKAVNLDGKGALVMGILKEGPDYFDSWVDSEKKFEQTYGFFTARMKMHQSSGHWIAFWLQCRTVGQVDGSGRDGTEIDIMEKPWLTGEVNHALHWDGYGKDHRSSGIRSQTPGIMEGWHTFSLLWTPTLYIFYIDGGEVWRTTDGGVCQVPAHLRLTDEAEATSKSWAGDLREAKLPDAFLVDYVRVYQHIDRAGAPVWKAPEKP